PDGSGARSLWRRLLGRARPRRPGRKLKPSERLEARRLQLLGEPAALQQRAAVLGQRAGAERREHAVEDGRAAPGVDEDLPCAGGEGRERLLLVAASPEERVAALSSDRLALGALELHAGVEQALHVELSLARQLVDHPGGQRRLAQLLDLVRERAVALMLDAPRQLVAPARELVERQTVEAADL